MEVILIIGGLWLLGAMWDSIFGGSPSTTQNVQPFSIKLVKQNSTTENPFEYYQVMGMGLVPVNYSRNISAVISVFDATEEQLEPVIAAFDDFYEPTTTCYYMKTDFGRVDYGTSVIKWVQMGAVIPQLLIPPKKGRRTIKVVLRLVDSDNVPEINMGYSDGKHAGHIQTYQTSFEYNFTELGYTEFAANELEVQKLTLDLGIVVAFSDGEFADEEGFILRDWINDQVLRSQNTDTQKLKSELNGEFKRFAGAGNFNSRKITDLLNEKASEAQKYRAIDLCLDVMAADGVADEGELVEIKKISEALNLNFDQIQKMKEQRLVGLEIDESTSESVESLLGIDASWSNEKINKHLRKQFSSWNSRVNTLDDPVEKENAQRMLDMIAEMRKKYSS